MLVSVVIPTFNRRGILEKCLNSLENQIIKKPVKDYEVIVVDDGSTDQTVDWLLSNQNIYPHVKLFQQRHGGPAQGRNLGVSNAKGEIIVFIDSDLVVVKDFISVHINQLIKAQQKLGDNSCFTYGTVINTSNFDKPSSEKFKLTDYSMAYFATGNVAIPKELLLKVGLFDSSFSLYGWEDLELGVRLHNYNIKLIKAPLAIGFHWHPPFSLNNISSLINKEKERAKMAILFLRKHPTFRVRLIIQKTIFHRLLWELLAIGGLINKSTLRPILKILISIGYPGIALEIFRIYLNLVYVRSL
tara:strand:- start:1228 stop:2130 length:903 start_codon:yes stop_codon:yes gene_type:complete